ncbi:hypothetical protein RRG08_066512 [Elysia crispata]|uniref:Uncharacterized protein n=1 Tax=Elysia crispata TaxID=231223 RepID=A0AAE1DIH8_9GAST|nr:hypothetical protein RRG08_066512 [Elysia crispata]
MGSGEIVSVFCLLLLLFGSHLVRLWSAGRCVVTASRLCHQCLLHGTMEPDSVINVCYMDPDSVINVCYMESDSVINVCYMESDSVINVCYVEPDSVINICYVEPDSVISVCYMEPDSVINVCYMEPDSIINVCYMESDSIINVCYVEPDSVINVCYMEPTGLDKHVKGTSSFAFTLNFLYFKFTVNALKFRIKLKAIFIPSLLYKSKLPSPSRTRCKHVYFKVYIVTLSRWPTFTLATATQITSDFTPRCRAQAVNTDNDVD